MEERGLLIGGVIPAVMLGLGTFLMKQSMRYGMSLSVYLMIVGATVLLCGFAAHLFEIPKSIGTSAVVYAVLMALAWAIATYCMGYGVSTLKLPVSLVAPITNSNALITILLGAIFLAEWRKLNFTKVGLGTLLIVAGATIVSTSTKD